MEKDKKFIFILRLTVWIVYLFKNIDENDGNSKNQFNGFFTGVGVALLLVIVVQPHSFLSGLLFFALYFFVGLIAHFFEKREWESSFLED